MRKLVTVALALVGVLSMGGVAQAGTEPAPPNETFGSGPAPTGGLTPVCAATTVYSYEGSVCTPLSSPVPQNTVQIDVTAACSITTDMEGAFTEDQMVEYLNCVIPGLDAWFKTAWTGAGPNAYVYIPSGMAGAVTPGVCSFDPTSLHYCPADGSIYFGHDTLWKMYSTIGDIAPTVALAHEYGHRMQHVAGVRSWAEDAPREEIPVENQADCISGVYTNALAINGNLALDDDVVDFAAGVIDAGVAESGQRSHGTIDQRMRAFYWGYNAGRLIDCVWYLTDLAILESQ